MQETSSYLSFRSPRHTSCRFLSLFSWLICLLGISTSSAYGGLLATYDLVVTSHQLPIMISESTAQLNLTIELVGAGTCASSWSGVTWDAEVDLNGTAGVADVGAPVPAVLTFSDTDPAVNLAIPLFDDLLQEPDETFEISLTPLMANFSCAMPPGGIEPNLNDYRIQVTIVDDDAGLEFTIDDTSVLEGDAGSPNVEVMVNLLNGPVQQPVTIDWTTTDGTATTGDNDYLPAMGTLTFLPGQSTATAFVPVVGDTIPESDEEFNVSISNPSEGTVTDSNADITILDDDTAPPVHLSVMDAQVVEGDSGQQNVVVSIELDGNAPADVTMDWTTFDGTATAADNDYQPAADFITIPAGDHKIDVVVSVLGDTLDEPDEFFEVKVLNVVGAIVTDDRGDVTIENDDALDLQIRVLDAQIVEGDAGTSVLEFVVEVEDVNTLVKTLPTLSVDFATVAGTATEGVDYQPASGTLNFADESNQTIQVQIVGDVENEPAESFIVQLSNPVDVTIVDGQATGRILNDDSPAGALTIMDAQLEEGDEGVTDMIFEVHLMPAQDMMVQVSYETLDGTADSDDYQARQGQLIFQPGDTVQTVRIPVIGDTEVEADESFQVRLFNALGSPIEDDLGDGLIVNDDSSPLPTLSIGDTTVAEGDFGTVSAELTVTLSAPSDTAVEVSFTTVDGTATGGTDFETRSGTATLPPGETSTTVTVSVFGDVQEEGDESFSVRLSDPTGADLEDSEGQVLILDDDQPAQLPRLSIEDARVVEGDQGQRNAVFTLRLEQQAKARIMVDFTTRDGSALASDNDYLSVSGRLDFDSGDLTTTLEVPVLGDTRSEDDETFFVDLSLPDGAVLGNATAQCVIVDDDSDGGPGSSAGSVRLIQAEPAMEGAGPAVIRVERFGGNTGLASVLVSTASGSASAGQDFTAVSRRVQWSNGQSGPLTIEVPILDDSLREDPEAFAVRLTAPLGVTLSAPNQISVSVVDDDTPMKLEAVGEVERAATVRREEDFQVRVLTEAGQPVEGAVIQWSTEGRARLTGDGLTSSNSEGLVTQTVLFDERPGDAQVIASLVGVDVSLSFSIEVEGDLGDTIGGGGDDDPVNEEGVARTLDESCADAGSSRYSQLCDYVYDQASTGDQREAVEQMTPRSALSQAQTAVRTPVNQIRNVTSRLSALRAGPSTGSSFGQLAFTVQGDGVSLGALQQAVVDFDDEEDAYEDPLKRALDPHRPRESPWAVRGGAASADDDPYEALDPYDSTESPWGFFMNGRASFGDAPRRGARLGYDFSTQGLTAGVDYRASDQWVVGASLGYSRSSNDIVGTRSGRNGGSIDSEGLSLSVFTSWYRNSFYLDGVVTFGQSDFDIERVIDLPVALNGVDRFVATGAPDSDELSIHVGFGYDFRLGGALSLGGFLNGNYVRATIDPYTETGADLLNLAYEDQELDSLLAEVGVELTYPYSVSWGVLQPIVRIAFLRELEDDVQVIRARFAEDPTGRRFRVTSERPDRSYLNVALGLTATLQRGWATYFQYDTDLEREDLDIYTLTGGFRFQF